MFMLLVRHGRQQSEKMHPKRAVMIKIVSSVDGVMGIREEENSREKKPGRAIYATRTLFDDMFGGQSAGGEAIVWSCLF